MFSRYRQLPQEERRALLPAFGRLLIARLLLPFGIARAAGWLGGPATPDQTTIDTELWMRRTVALGRVARAIPDAQCLARALALRWWMRRTGIDAKVVIGVRSTNQGFSSHAWVEVQGQRFDTGQPEIFTEIQRY